MFPNDTLFVTLSAVPAPVKWRYPVPVAFVKLRLEIVVVPIVKVDMSAFVANIFGILAVDVPMIHDVLSGLKAVP